MPTDLARARLDAAYRAASREPDFGKPVFAELRALFPDAGAWIDARCAKADADLKARVLLGPERYLGRGSV